MQETSVEFPRLVFEPAFALDTAVADPAPNEEWDKLLQWIPIAQQRWIEEGEPLLRETVRLLKQPFGRLELSVALSLSHLPSMSYPLVVNVKALLGTSTPWPEFFSVVHHELLHRYLNENFSPRLKSSPLLRKYLDQGEDRMVRAHLHLFAVQREVYSRLERRAELDQLERSNQGDEKACYRRAWEIVSRLEAKQAFMADLVDDASGTLRQ